MKLKTLSALIFLFISCPNLFGQEAPPQDPFVLHGQNFSKYMGVSDFKNAQSICKSLGGKLPGYVVLDALHEWKNPQGMYFKSDGSNLPHASQFLMSQSEERGKLFLMESGETVPAETTELKGHFRCLIPATTIYQADKETRTVISEFFAGAVSSISLVFLIFFGSAIYFITSKKKFRLEVVFAALLLAAIFGTVNAYLFTLEEKENIELISSGKTKVFFGTVTNISAERITVQNEYAELQFPHFPQSYILQKDDEIVLFHANEKILQADVNRAVDILHTTSFFFYITTAFLFIPGLVIFVVVILALKNMSRKSEIISQEEQGRAAVHSEKPGGWFNRDQSFFKRPMQYTIPYVKVALYDDMIAIRHYFNSARNENIILRPENIMDLKIVNTSEAAKETGLSRYWPLTAMFTVLLGPIIGARGILIRHDLKNTSNPVVLWPEKPEELLEKMRQALKIH